MLEVLYNLSLVPIPTSLFPFEPSKSYSYHSPFLNYETHHVSSILHIRHTLECITPHCHGHLFSWLTCSDVKQRFLWLPITWLQDYDVTPVSMVMRM
jgi:hypothetical protein